jgi:hypothetical protein
MVLGVLHGGRRDDCGSVAWCEVGGVRDHTIVTYRAYVWQSLRMPDYLRVRLWWATLSAVAVKGAGEVGIGGIST